MRFFVSTALMMIAMSANAHGMSKPTLDAAKDAPSHTLNERSVAATVSLTDKEQMPKVASDVVDSKGAATNTATQGVSTRAKSNQTSTKSSKSAELGNKTQESKSARPSSAVKAAANGLGAIGASAAVAALIPDELDGKVDTKKAKAKRCYEPTTRVEDCCWSSPY